MGGQKMAGVRVVVDAMGGDDAPGVVVRGCVDAINQEKDIKIILVGKEDAIQEELNMLNYNKDQLEIVHAADVIENTDSPVMAIRRKKESSLVKALNLVKEQKGDAIISAGNTGALLAGATLIIGRIQGVERPCLATLLPNRKGFSLLVDSGANVDCKPSYLVQFAQMGATYYEGIMGISEAEVGLVNIGVEDTKGNQLAKEAYTLLKDNKTISFLGNVEARDIPNGDANVIVCDGFVGNVILKYTEGFASTIFDLIKEAVTAGTISTIGALLIRKSMRRMKKKFDYTEYGGAPLLGLKGLVVKTHGSADAKAIKNTVLQCKKFHDEKINEKILSKISIN
jgi:glycerol-3-phosphate acyltransferase PlsX